MIHSMKINCLQRLTRQYKMFIQNIVVLMMMCFCVLFIFLPIVFQLLQYFLGYQQCSSRRRNVNNVLLVSLYKRVLCVIFFTNHAFFTISILGGMGNLLFLSGQLGVVGEARLYIRIATTFLPLSCNSNKSSTKPYITIILMIFNGVEKTFFFSSSSSFGNNFFYSRMPFNRFVVV